MAALIVLAVTFLLLWVLFILPQQRRVRAHQALVAAVEPGDEVVLSAGIFGRIVELGPEEMTLAVAPGVEIRVARQAVLRRVEHAVDDGGDDAGVEVDDPYAILDETSRTPAADGDAPGTRPAPGEASPDQGDRGTAAPGSNV
jgi:preprotein translocase subunit YajC